MVYHVQIQLPHSTATYNLQLNGGTFSLLVNHLLVSLNSVLSVFNFIQRIWFTDYILSALTSSDNINFIMALGNFDVGTPTDGTVNGVSGTSISNAVTTAKILMMY